MRINSVLYIIGCLYFCYLYIYVLAAPDVPLALLLKRCSTGAESAPSTADINSLVECQHITHSFLLRGTQVSFDRWR